MSETHTKQKQISGIAAHCSFDRAVDLVDLVEHPSNPNKHSDKQIALLAKIIRNQGWRNPIVVSNRSGFIISGHGRLAAARLLDVETVPVDYQDFASEAEEHAHLIADNRIAELAEIDKGELISLLGELDGQIDLELTGFDLDTYSKLLGSGSENDDSGVDAKMAKAAELQKKWKTKAGQLWQLGDHRIVCGDCTDGKVFKLVMGKDQAHLVHTDPPYGVSYEGVPNDDLREDGLVGLIKPSLENAMKHTVSTAAFYIWHASATRPDFMWAIKSVGLEEKQYLVWVKDRFTLGRSHYQWQSEPCFYCQKAGQQAAWHGDRKQSTVWRFERKPKPNELISIQDGLRISDGAGNQILVKPVVTKNSKLRLFRTSQKDVLNITNNNNTDAWEISKDKASTYQHPTQKPVALAEKAIWNNTTTGQVVLDFFSGSGSTLMACEQTGRQGRAIELDPGYVAVTLERWAEATGKEPKLCN